ncbi:MFS transporter [Altererythrobacter sp. KTW20L]|uniref:MFS transporter n=1 Tax=Altererythrobacter sp. KTW20L TaxID=2942210 RepID=UPI0020BF6617|nr:MFS transporter [Altererythrobacter sp. KTW20L]MCL6250273.1 MFS transporter [Altererythrobacter sp. KTW20L]
MQAGAQAPLPADDPRQILGNRRMTPAQYLVVAICILVNMIDGYDILAISLAGAALKAQWGLSDAALGTLFAMHLVGMAIGALSVSPVADQWGRRPAILFCLLLMSVGMAWAALSQSYAEMVAARILTGVGIGGMTSTVGMIALEYASFRRREFAASAVASAYPVGVIIGASVAATTLDGLDWRVIFWTGAALSALLFPIAFVLLPESLDFLLNRQPKGALAKTNRMLDRMSIARIDSLPPKPAGSKDAVLAEISQGFHVRELLKLFLAHSLNMFAWYFILQWGTPLVAESTGSSVTGANFSEWVSFGGIAGGLTAGYLCGLWGVRRVMWFTMLGLGASIAAFGQLSGNPGALVLLAPLIGGMLFGSATANWLTITYAFPPQLRATGLGFATTAGRVGAVGGPYIGGLLLNTRETGAFEIAGMSFPMTLTIASVCMIMAVPAVLSAITFGTARRWDRT